MFFISKRQPIPLMLEFDIAKLAKLAHAKGAKVVVDNTFTVRFTNVRLKMVRISFFIQPPSIWQATMMSWLGWL